MKKKTILMSIIVICFVSLLFAYTPTPAPPLDPLNVPFAYDTAMTPAPIAWKIISAGNVLKAAQMVTDEHRDMVSLTVILPNGSVIVAGQTSVIDDPDDPDGDSSTPPDNDIVGLRYMFHWEWPTTIADVGVKQIKLKAMDSDGLYSEASIVVYVKDNKPPVIGGCTLQ